MPRTLRFLAASAALLAILPVAGRAVAGDKEVRRQDSFGGSCVK